MTQKKVKQHKARQKDINTKPYEPRNSHLHKIHFVRTNIYLHNHNHIKR